MLRMPVVRVSTSLFEEARKDAAAMSRSVAGQLEYWARLGRAVEAAGLAVHDVKELLYRKRAASDDPFARLLRGEGARVYEVSGAALQEAKQARQRLDIEAQKAGLVSSSRMSPFAGARVSARIREVALDE
jgi:short subunit dehydrogenase-like uncharacterized protein